jgi:drug/metabolite transporter (DMT)-like permease
MSLVAISMVLSAAVIHAVWNTLAKRSEDAIAFMWAIAVAGLVIYLIPFLILAPRETWELDWLRFAVTSGVIHVFYSALLGIAYTRSDLSFAYPIARGTGLMLVPILAVPVFGDRPTLVAWGGIGLVVCGILWLHRPVFQAMASRGEVRDLFSVPAFLTGLTIAVYSINDTAGVHRANPIVYLFVVFFVESVILTPYILKRRLAAARATLKNRVPLIVGGAGSFGTYMIVLAATRLAPVSYVVPMRETSIVIGAILGAKMLGESLGANRLGACVLVVAGVIAIGVGG